MIPLSRIVTVNVDPATLPPRPVYKPLVWRQDRPCVFLAEDEYSTFKLRYLGGRWRVWISGYRTSSWYPALWYAKWGIDRIREINFAEPLGFTTMAFITAKLEPGPVPNWGEYRPLDGKTWER